MKIYNYLAITFFLLLSSRFIYAGTYSGGTGTSDDPYKIATAADLIELSNTNADWVAGIYFIQTANVTFNENEQLVDWDGDGTATWDAEDQLGFNPIGKSIHNSFRGTYDGQYYTILNLYINRTATSNIGLFGFIRGTIANLGLLNAIITGLNTVGGLVGVSLNGEVNNSFATGIINGNSSIGGLIGHNNYGIVTNSYSTASVVGISNYVGGFAGRLLGGEISFCYSTGSVSGADYIGGFVGSVDLGGGISNSYSTGDASGINYVGGFTGLNSMVISNCYSTGNVSGTSFVGGLLGSNSGTVNNCFWDTETSGQSSSAGGTGKTTADMKTQSTFTDASWDFSGDAETDWVMSSNISFFAYPTLRWTGGYAVAPTGSPKEIASLPNLVWVAENSTRWTDSYAQTADLIMWTTPSWDGNQGWTPMGNSSVYFAGTYDGQNNTISKLFINRTTDYTGLFGFTYDSGERVKNLGLRQVYITGSNYVSALVGINMAGTISNSYSTGIIKATGFYVGSLVGFNYFGTISNSFSSGQVNGTGECVGGLVGYQFFGSTNNSYSTSDVNGSSNYVGGLVAYKHFGSVNNSYSSGNVTSSGTSVGGLIGFNLGENVNNCFWDTQTSGQASSSGGTGKTTSEMKTESTFSDWDFSTIWNIQSGDFISYPYLQNITYDNPGANPAINPIPGLRSAKHYVTTTGTGAKNGSSWSNAFEGLQAALDVAVSGDEIWVKAGTYKPTSSYDLTNSSRYYHFRLIDGVEIYGGFNGTETSLSERDYKTNVTILSGDHNGDDVVSGNGQTLTLSNNSENSYHVFYNIDDNPILSSATILDGFTISGANSDNPNPPHFAGAGIFQYRGSPIIRNCVFKNNFALYGAAGLLIYEGSAQVINCIISHNKGGLGAGLTIYDASSNIINCQLTDNYSTSMGGAVYNTNNSNSNLINCTIANNFSQNGGGISSDFSANLNVNNSIIWANTASNSGKQIYISSGYVNLNYSNFANGTGDVYGTVLPLNCINSDPLFADPNKNEFSILGNSPSFNAGSNLLNSESTDIRGENRIQNNTIDMGAYEWTSGTDKSNPVYVSEDYSNGNPNGFGITHFNNLTTALSNASTDATVNITNYSHTGDVDMTGRTFVVGAQDFDLTGNLSGGQIQVTNTGKLIMKDLSANTTKTFPITDGTYNYTMTITTADVNNPDISVRISNLNPTGSINSDFWDIEGPINLNATVTLRVDKASIAPKTLNSTSQLRYRNTGDTRFVPVNGNNFSIEEFDTYYIITLNSVNEF